MAGRHQRHNATAYGYDQTASTGQPVLVGSGVFGGSGLRDGQTLASAAAGAGIGIAELDAWLVDGTRRGRRRSLRGYGPKVAAEPLE